MVAPTSRPNFDLRFNYLSCRFRIGMIALAIVLFVRDSNQFGYPASKFQRFLGVLFQFFFLSFARPFICGNFLRIDFQSVLNE